MRRRTFIAALGGVAAWPLVARAQQPPKGRVAHIAYLGLTSPSVLDPRQIEQFKRGLAENGLAEGRDIMVDYLWAEGNPERLNQLAAELARRDLDVIVTAGPQPVRVHNRGRRSNPFITVCLFPSSPVFYSSVEDRKSVV